MDTSAHILAIDDDKTLAYLKEEAGKHFDPAILEKFILIQREGEGG